MNFASKADTLEILRTKIKKAKVLPQICVNAWDWDPQVLKCQLEEKKWSDLPLIVRSSASIEDLPGSSSAGKFLSIGSIQGFNDLCFAIKKVAESYQVQSFDDQIFIQPMLTSVKMSGVIFSCDPSTGAPYRIINYDDVSGSTDLVTSGKTNHIKTYISYPGCPGPFDSVMDMLEELESYFSGLFLDIEFAISNEEELFLLQARPLCHLFLEQPIIAHRSLVKLIENKLKLLNQPHPYLLGKKTFLGIMPDWNPAELIGVRPRLLALSLYKEIITDRIWSIRRADYGYRDMQGFPILIHLHGIPYIDVRVSFNSLVPASLNKYLAEKLVNYYLDKLDNEPHLHDKIEFEIVFSCYTLDFPSRLRILLNHGFDEKELTEITAHIKILTNQIIDIYFFEDLQALHDLEQKFDAIQKSSLDDLSKIYWLINDVKRYGTAPFSGIARSAFIAMQILDSLVQIDLLSLQEKETFLSSLNTVCRDIQNSYNLLDLESFLDQYGHLRQGTYDILSPRYDEMDNFHFGKSSCPSKEISPFVFEKKEMINDVLKEHGINQTVETLFTFIRSAITGREKAKFLFTRNVSLVLDLIKKLDFSLDDCSYLDIKDILNLYSNNDDIYQVLKSSVIRGKQLHIRTKQVLLPPLIKSPNEVWSFELREEEPNYITLKKTEGEVCLIEKLDQDLDGKIVMLSTADPGFDWIFTHAINGFITMYGGRNSHMAIRAIEMGIPAVIGAGELLFRRWSQALILFLDCESKFVRIIK